MESRAQLSRSAGTISTTWITHFEHTIDTHRLLLLFNFCIKASHPLSNNIAPLLFLLHLLHDSILEHRTTPPDELKFQAFSLARWSLLVVSRSLHSRSQVRQHGNNEDGESISVACSASGWLICIRCLMELASVRAGKQNASSLPFPRLLHGRKHNRLKIAKDQYHNGDSIELLAF